MLIHQTRLVGERIDIDVYDGAASPHPRRNHYIHQNRGDDFATEHVFVRLKSGAVIRISQKFIPATPLDEDPELQHSIL